MKKNRINNKGFTLIELLVTMTILSIITAMAIPLLRNLTEGTTNKKCETYKDSIVYASKLYIDSYSEDLFDQRESGCAYIDLESLIERSLARDIEMDNISCINSESYIQVVKMGDKYTFKPFLSCGEKKENGAVENGFSYPEGAHQKDETACGGFESEFSMNISPSLGGTEESYKKAEIEFVISSYTGIAQNADISYAFGYDDDVNHIFTEWNKASINVASASEQRKQIKNGSIINATTDKIYTPDSADGDIFLFLRIDTLTDLYGEKWTAQKDKILSYGPYRIDNSTPVVNSLGIYKEKNKWYFDANITDETNFEGNYYKLCPTTRNSSVYCNERSQFTINANLPSDITDYVVMPGGTYDKWGKFCAKVTDYAGNISDEICSTKTEYRIRMYQNDGTNDYKIATIELNSEDDKKANEEILKTQPEARPGYKFLNWSTDAKKNTPVRGDLPFVDAYNSLYAFWEQESVELSLLNVDPTNNADDTVIVPDNQRYCLPTLTKNGYVFKGWTSRSWNGTPHLGEDACITPKITDVYKTYSANWEEEEVTINLLNVDPTNHDDDTVEVPAATNYCLPNLQKNGYVFLGWTSRSWNGTPRKGNDACFMPKNDFYKTYTANWGVA